MYSRDRPGSFRFFFIRYTQPNSPYIPTPRRALIEPYIFVYMLHLIRVSIMQDCDSKTEVATKTNKRTMPQVSVLLLAAGGGQSKSAVTSRRRHHHVNVSADARKLLPAPSAAASASVNGGKQLLARVVRFVLVRIDAFRQGSWIG